MVAEPLHPFVEAYLDHLRSADKVTTAGTNATYLGMFTRWLASQGLALSQDTITPDVLARFQVHITREYRTKRGGGLLAERSQVTAIIVLRGFFAWLHKRGLMLFNPAAGLVPPTPAQRLTVAKDHLDLQEAIALVATCAALVDEAKAGTNAWALAMRDHAAICLDLATGRRCHGLCGARVADLDQEQNEIRVEYEKGKTGRVLPVAAWAVRAVQRYLTQARPLLLRGKDSPFLFVSQRAVRLCERGFAYLLDAVVEKTISRNPDLTALPTKTISTHSLRVTFAATLMFPNGCGIRALNELMLHTSLNTTAQYTPIPLEDLRRVLLTTHPRA